MINSAAEEFSVTTGQRPRVALLVDGENLSSSLAGQLITNSRMFGDLAFVRVYGDVSRLPGWETAHGYSLIHSGKGKNATDLLLAIAAMDIMLTKRADVLVVASSDRDFTHLATWMRENGYKMIGIGESKTCKNLRKACSKFIQIGVPSPKPEEPKPPTLDELICKLIREKGGTGGLPMSSINPVMLKSGVIISQQEQKTWRSYLMARPKLFDCDAKGPDAKVRLV